MSSLSFFLSRCDNFEFDLKIFQEDQNVYTIMFQIFLLKTPAGLWNLCPDLSMVHNG